MKAAGRAYGHARQEESLQKTLSKLYCIDDSYTEDMEQWAILRTTHCAKISGDLEEDTCPPEWKVRAFTVEAVYEITKWFQRRFHGACAFD